jgi:hypothetical protein
MNIISYVKRNYEKLPKSNFDGQSLVVVKEIENEDYGYGHHSYEGVGIDEEGKVYWLFSSGCSCNASVSVDHREAKTPKALIAGMEMADVDPKEVDFESLQVSFESY